LSNFYIDSTEVNQTSYTTYDGGHTYNNVGGTNPADKISWTNAGGYCASVGKRRPTEAEWEYTARNRGQVVTYATGSNTLPTCTDANYSGCQGGGSSSTTVGNLPPGGSPISLFNMAANVSEWVEDKYWATYYDTSPLTNPKNTGAGTQYVARGGTYNWTAGNLVPYTRVFYTGATFALNNTGFRCAQ
jgi:formylglycine-generating enzyme required for sulfatase activity